LKHKILIKNAANISTLQNKFRSNTKYKHFKEAANFRNSNKNLQTSDTTIQRAIQTKYKHLQINDTYSTKQAII
jgi:hypothetical protein